MIWASMGENMSSGCLTKYGQSQPAQLQRLARTLKFRMEQVRFLFFPDRE